MNLNIRVGFSTSKSSWVSKIIRWFTKSKWSHVFFVYYDVDFSRDMVMEATEGGFRIVPFLAYTKNSDTLKVITPKYSIDPGLLTAVDWLGEHYDYTGLIGMAWVMLWRWLGRKIHNPLHAAGSMFCSEAVVRTMQAAQYPGSMSYDPPTTTPEDLDEFFALEHPE